MKNAPQAAARAAPGRVSSFPASQRGATLLVVLIMLVVLTLFVVSAINISSVNMRIVGNMQHRTAAEALAQTAIEHTLNDATYFYTPGSVVPVPEPAGMDATVAPRVCLGADAATGYSAAQQIVPEDTYWHVQVTVVDSVTSAQTVMHQGVKMRMLANNCPA
jgi:Tfp pilus assembly protein PilX